MDGMLAVPFYLLKHRWLILLNVLSNRLLLSYMHSRSWTMQVSSFAFLYRTNRMASHRLLIFQGASFVFCELDHEVASL